MGISVSLAGIGSIPAHAGEPFRTGATRSACTVYPRPRGGATSEPPPNRKPGGLSPPTRGSHQPYEVTGTTWGSIPAHAGEPVLVSTCASTCAVYPRPRGGATSESHATPMESGLSPPTRGSPPRGSHDDHPPRSIPAHAGEPQPPASPPTVVRVYPRPRGGAGKRRRENMAREGLSPPTRGSHTTVETAISGLGSIPAHAGEPWLGASLATQRAVYPRPRGGAPLEPRGMSAPYGLSPPTRGSHLHSRGIGGR